MPCTSEEVSYTRVVWYCPQGEDAMCDAMMDENTRFDEFVIKVNDLEDFRKHLTEGVLVVFAPSKLGKGSAKTLKKWKSIVESADKLGGTVLLRLPECCEDWNSSLLGKFAIEFGPTLVKRAPAKEFGDRDMKFMTNNTLSLIHI